MEIIVLTIFCGVFGLSFCVRSGVDGILLRSYAPDVKNQSQLDFVLSTRVIYGF